MKKIAYILIVGSLIFITSCTKVVSPPMPGAEIAKTDNCFNYWKQVHIANCRYKSRFI